MSSQLRLALGMRGGVSLAVWIGGAGVEIDTLCSDHEAGFWRKLCKLSGFDSVVVDVIAGASAGGLNGVLFAASQQYGFALDEVRDVWLQVGGIEVLTRKEGGASPSLLDGDERFLRVVHDELTRLIGLGKPREDRPLIDLQLSATLVEPIIRSARSPFDEQLTTRRSAAGFRFRHDPRGGPSDFPSVDDPTFDDALWRLAVAARATSSFPVAFEGTFVRSTRAPSFAITDPPTGGEFLVDMRGVFSERNTADEAIARDKPRPSDFVVADGGILDNIPLGKAIMAIQRAPADRPTTRYLIYLHPGAPEPDPRTVGAAAKADPDRAAAIRRSTVGVLRGVFKAYYTSETITDDIAAIEAHNERVVRAAVIRQGRCATFHGRPTRTELLRVAGEEFDSYRLQRALEDAALIQRLLDDPLTVLGGDFFPTRAGKDADGRWRSPMAAWPEARREQLSAHLVEAFGSRMPRDLDGTVELSASDAWVVLLTGVRPFARTTQMLMEWARYIESRVGGTAKEEAGRVKECLHAVADFAEVAFELPRRLGWVDLAIRPDAGGSAWVGSTCVALNRLLMTDERTASAVRKGLVDRTDGAKSFVRSVYEALDAEARPQAQPAIAANAVDLRKVLVDSVLMVHARTLNELARDLPPLSEDKSVDRASSADRSSDLALGDLLNDLIAGEDDVDHVKLAALEIIRFAEVVAGAPGQQRIDFVRLSAASPSPIAAWFDTLTSGSPVTAAPAAPDRCFVPIFPADHPREGKPFHELIPLTQKLAGNELLNFAAFLRDQWRTNDWMWGRLDAVPTLVDLLITPQSMKSWVSSVADPLGSLHDLVVSDFPAAAGLGWPEWLRKNVWTVYAEEIAREVEQLRAGADAPRVDAIRGALMARRQWEILADELGRSVERGQQGSGPRPPNECADEVEKWSVGTETLTKPARENTVEAFRGIGSAAVAQSIKWHAEAIANSSPLADSDPRRKQRKPPLVTAANWTSKAVQMVGPVAASMMLSEKGALSLVKRPSVTVLLVVTALGLLLWAILESWLAVALVIVALVIGVVAINRLGKRARKTVATTPVSRGPPATVPPPPSGPTEPVA